MLGNLINPETIDALATFAKLKSIGDKVVAINATPADLARIAEQMGSTLSPDVATKMVDQIPNYVNGLEQTLTQFVANGGLFRMLTGVMMGTTPQSAGRCNHCNNLVFF